MCLSVPRLNQLLSILPVTCKYSQLCVTEVSGYELIWDWDHHLCCGVSFMLGDRWKWYDVVVMGIELTHPNLHTVRWYGTIPWQIPTKVHKSSKFMNLNVHYLILCTLHILRKSEMIFYYIFVFSYLEFKGQKAIHPKWCFWEEIKIVQNINFLWVRGSQFFNKSIIKESCYFSKLMLQRTFNRMGVVLVVVRSGNFSYTPLCWMTSL